jgi:hypothetical protein
MGHYYIFPNGSRIKLVGLDKNPNGLRGNTLDLIVIDECGFVTNLDYIYKSVIIPATLHRPNCKIIMISTPPSTPAHPLLITAKKQKQKVPTSNSTFLPIQGSRKMTLSGWLRKWAGGIQRRFAANACASLSPIPIFKSSPSGTTSMFKICLGTNSFSTTTNTSEWIWA